MKLLPMIIIILANITLNRSNRKKMFFFKVLITGESASTIDLLRRACGGHGFMTNSGLPRLAILFIVLSFRYIRLYRVYR